MNKKGISLLILVVSVIVLSILVTVSVIGIDNAVSAAKKVSFTEELLNVQETAIAKLQSGTLIQDISYADPVRTRAELSALLKDEKKKAFDKIVTEESSKYVQIDLKKLGATSGERGYGEKKSAVNPDISDDYFYLETSSDFTEVRNIIYLRGSKIDGKMYFKLTSELVENENVKVGETTKVTTGTNNPKFSVVKQTLGYSNEVEFLIDEKEATPTSSVYIQPITGGTRVGINVTNRRFILNKMTLGSLDVSNVNTVKVYKGSSSTEYAIADISNLDVEPPALGNPILTKDLDTNEVKIYATDDKSGVEEYIYAPTQKFDETGKTKVMYYETNLKAYTSISTATVNTYYYTIYINTFGQKSKSNIIEIPSDAIRYGIIVKDKAGNVANARDYAIN